MRTAGPSCSWTRPRSRRRPERGWLGNNISLQGREALAPAVARAGGAEGVRVDPAGSPVWLAQTCAPPGRPRRRGPGACLMPKRVQEHGRAAGARATAFGGTPWRWPVPSPGSPAGRGRPHRDVAADRLLAFRRARSRCSRPRVSPRSRARGSTGRSSTTASTPSERPADPRRGVPDRLGRAVPEGTTDVTRTIWTGPLRAPEALRARFTRVLKGHIAFRRWCSRRGRRAPHLDAFARRALWERGSTTTTGPATASAAICRA